ncbi:hypothetical protein, partial [Streptomyces atacamensis]|uniref:hypothetical protein n=1 Tax=Streptomyces atacamensis TaxID=531966 RepID=UPI00399D3781
MSWAVRRINLARLPPSGSGAAGRRQPRGSVWAQCAVGEDGVGQVAVGERGFGEDAAGEGDGAGAADLGEGRVVELAVLEQHIVQHQTVECGAEE